MVVMATRATSKGFYSFIEENNHHDAWRLIVLVAIVAAVAVVSWLFYGREKSVSDPIQYVIDQEGARRTLLAAPNPPVHLSSAELQSRQALFSSPNTPRQLSVDEIEQRMRLLQAN